MKSIIQEASSVAKAIEAAWLKAGKPQNFSIKIFQEAEKNFFGITSKPAKIAILFNDFIEEHAPKTKVKQQKPPVEREKSTAISTQKIFEKKTEKTAVSSHAKDTTQETDIQKPSILWSEELQTFIKTWLEESLARLGYNKITFSMHAQRQLLKIQFSEPLIKDELKQKNLFRNLALLLLQSARRDVKRPLRNARVVLLSEKLD